MIEISLVNKYDTEVYHGDYSHGTFFDGCVCVNTKEEANAIIEQFLRDGQISLHEATDRYLNAKVSTEMTTLLFTSKEKGANFLEKEYVRGRHVFGDGYTSKATEFKYKTFYWLRVRIVV